MDNSVLWAIPGKCYQSIRYLKTSNHFYDFLQFQKYPQNFGEYFQKSYSIRPTKIKNSRSLKNGKTKKQLGRLDYYRAPLTEEQFKRHKFGQFEIVIVTPSDAKKIQYYYQRKAQDAQRSGQDIQTHRVEQLRTPEHDPGIYKNAIFRQFQF